MKRGRKWIFGIFLILFVVYIAGVTRFVNLRRQKVHCSGIEITVCDSLVNSFIRPAGITAVIMRDMGKVIGEPLYRLDLRRIEQLLNRQGVVRKSEAFVSIDGVLHIKLYQRRPVIRIQALAGSFYIDDTGYIFPLSKEHTSYVPVVTGNVPMKIPQGYRGTIPEEEQFLKQLHEFALFLDKHEFWRVQIVQLHVRNVSEIDLTPREGREIIRLGSLERYEYKLDKLKAFYYKVLHAGQSGLYSHIDLRYGNQIIGKKKK